MILTLLQRRRRQRGRQENALGRHHHGVRRDRADRPARPDRGSGTFRGHHEAGVDGPDLDPDPDLPRRR